MKQLTKQIDQLLNGQRRHVLLHADCLDAGRALPSEIFDSCIIDPPYGMHYQGKNNKQPKIANDDVPFIWWLNDAFRALKSPGALACFCQWKGQEDFRTAIRLARFDIRSHVIWDRLNGGMGATHCTFAPRHDVIWFATKGRFAFPNGRPDSILPAANVAPTRRFHSTQKPPALMERLVRVLTPAGGIVFDPCMGSGSTGEAAIRAGYRFVGIELEKRNFNIARTRIAQAEKAVASDGDIKTKRVPPTHASFYTKAVA